MKHDLKCMATGSLPLTYIDLVSTVRRNLNHTRKQNGNKQFLARFPTKAQFRFVEHHLAHAISAYSFSGFDDAAVLVLDGRGAWEASSLWHGRDGRLEHVWAIPWPNSLGLFYAQFTCNLDTCRKWETPMEVVNGDFLFIHGLPHRPYFALKHRDDCL